MSDLREAGSGLWDGFTGQPQLQTTTQTQTPWQSAYLQHMMGQAQNLHGQGIQSTNLGPQSAASLQSQGLLSGMANTPFQAAQQNTNANPSALNTQAQSMLS